MECHRYIQRVVHLTGTHCLLPIRLMVYPMQLLIPSLGQKLKKLYHATDLIQVITGWGAPLMGMRERYMMVVGPFKG